MAETELSNRPAEAGRLPKDLIVGLALLGFCAVVYWITLGFREAPPALAQNVQPATFPRWVIGVIAAMALLLIALGFRAREKTRALPPPPVFITGAMMIGFVIAFDTLGILAAMGLFAFLMPILWGERRYHYCALFAIAFPAAVYLVFAVGLGVYFAPGIVEQAIDVVL